MKPKRADYLNFAKSGLIVAAAMGLVFLIALRVTVLPLPVRTILGVLLIVPGELIFMPMILSEGHNVWYGYFYIGGVLNWFLYTWFVWLFIQHRRRKRELRRTKPSADVVPPDRLPPDQSAK
jgi:hypothetical protein